MQPKHEDKIYIAKTVRDEQLNPLTAVPYPARKSRKNCVKMQNAVANASENGPRNVRQ